MEKNTKETGGCNFAQPKEKKQRRSHKVLYIVSSVVGGVAILGGIRYCHENYYTVEGQYKQGVKSFEQKDWDDAFEWFSKAAEQGDARAQDYLSSMYTVGRGVVEDSAQAAYWCIKAAEQGHLRATRNAGRIFLHGIGVPKDETKALEWLVKAADYGDAEAQFMVGMMYNKGQGVKIDKAKALEWIRKAVANGYEDYGEARSAIASIKRTLEKLETIKTEQAAKINNRKEKVRIAREQLKHSAKDDDKLAFVRTIPKTGLSMDDVICQLEQRTSLGEVQVEYSAFSGDDFFMEGGHLLDHYQQIVEGKETVRDFAYIAYLLGFICQQETKDLPIGQYLETFLSSGASPNDAFQNNTPMDYIVRYGKEDCVKVLLEHGFDVNLRSKASGEYPLHLAADKGMLETCKQLIEYGADVNVKDRKGDTPLRKANQNNHKDVSELLKKAGGKE